MKPLWTSAHNRVAGSMSARPLLDDSARDGQVPQREFVAGAYLGLHSLEQRVSVATTEHDLQGGGPMSPQFTTRFSCALTGVRQDRIGGPRE